MSDAIKSQEIANEKKVGKGLFIAAVLSVFFPVGIFYMAMSNEPDYMPSKQNQSQPHISVYRTSTVIKPCLMKK